MSKKNKQTETDTNRYVTVQIPADVHAEARLRAAQERGATISGLFVRGFKLLQKLEARAAQRRKP